MRPMTSRTRVGLTACLAVAAAVPTAVSPALAQTPAAQAATTSTAAASAPLGGGTPAAARPARSSLRVSSTRRTVMAGGRTVVRGRLRGAKHASGTERVLLQRRTGAGWTTVARDRASAAGAFRLRYAPPSTGSLALRVRFAGTSSLRRSSKAVGRVNVYRRAFASWYGPGLYGNKLACGGTLSAGTLGVAHKTLPCGTMVTLKHGDNTVRVPVVDRGPYVGGRDFDLTAATKAALGFGSTGTVLSTK